MHEWSREEDRGDRREERVSTEDGYISAKYDFQVFSHISGLPMHSSLCTKSKCAETRCLETYFHKQVHNVSALCQLTWTQFQRHPSLSCLLPFLIGITFSLFFFSLGFILILFLILLADPRPNFPFFKVTRCNLHVISRFPCAGKSLIRSFYSM